MPKKYTVTAQWDDEARVWVATSEDIPGLVTEATTLDELLKRVVAVTPELLDDNAVSSEGVEHVGDLVDVHIISELRLGGDLVH